MVDLAASSTTDLRRRPVLYVAAGHQVIDDNRLGNKIAAKIKIVGESGTVGRYSNFLLYCSSCTVQRWKIFAVFALALLKSTANFLDFF